MQHATRATRRIQSDELCPKRNVSPKLSPVRGAFLNARLRDRSIVVVVVVVVVVVLLVDFWFAWSGRVPPTRIDFDRETEKPCPCLTATAVQGRGTREGCVTTTRRGERTSTVRLSQCRGATLKFRFPDSTTLFLVQLLSHFHRNHLTPGSQVSRDALDPDRECPRLVT